MEHQELLTNARMLGRVNLATVALSWVVYALTCGTWKFSMTSMLACRQVGPILLLGMTAACYLATKVTGVVAPALLWAAIVAVAFTGADTVEHIAAAVAGFALASYISIMYRVRARPSIFWTDAPSIVVTLIYIGLALSGQDVNHLTPLAQVILVLGTNLPLALA